MSSPLLPVLIRGSAYQSSQLLKPDAFDFGDMTAAKRMVREQTSSPKAWEELAKTYVKTGLQEHALASYQIAKRFGTLSTANHNLNNRITDAPHLMATFRDPEAKQSVKLFIERFGVISIQHTRQALSHRSFTLGYHWNISPYNPQTPHFPIVDGLILSEADDVTAQPLWHQALNYLWQDLGVNMDLSSLRRHLIMAHTWEGLAQELDANSKPEQAHWCYEMASHLDSSIQKRRALVVQAKEIAIQTTELHPKEVIGPKLLSINKVIQTYFERLRHLSDDNETRLVSDRVDFPSNEYSYTFALEDTAQTEPYLDEGGTYIGTSAALYLTHMSYQKAEHGYVIDCNATVTEAIIPATGILLMTSNSPEEFLANLVGVVMTESLRQSLSKQTLPQKLKTILAQPRDEKFHNELLKNIISLIIPHLPQIDRFALTANFLKEFSSLLTNRAHAEIISDYMSKKSETGRGGILSSEEAYQKAVDIWKNNSVIGVTADWTGSVSTRIKKDMEQMSFPPAKLLYVSNIPDYISDDEDDTLQIKFGQSLSKFSTTDNASIIVMKVGGAKGDIIPLKTYLQLLPQDDERETGLHRLYHNAERIVPETVAWDSFKDIVELLVLTGNFKGIQSLTQAILNTESNDSPNKLEATAQRYNLSERDRIRFFYIVKRASL